MDTTYLNAAPYVEAHDGKRLTSQLSRVYTAMQSGYWYTLNELSHLTSTPEASVSAHIRSLRKEKHGAHTVDRRIRGDRSRGLWEYRLEVEEG
jgi:hypothetical protein